jgi:hypothetical protein
MPVNPADHQGLVLSVDALPTILISLEDGSSKKLEAVARIVSLAFKKVLALLAAAVS